MVLESIEPFGERGNYFRTGILASVIANVHRDKKKRPRPYDPSDFMPDLREQRGRQSQSEIHAKFAAIKESIDRRVAGKK